MGMDGAVGGQKTDNTKGHRRDISLGIQGESDRKKEITTRFREEEIRKHSLFAFILRLIKKKEKEKDKHLTLTLSLSLDTANATRRAYGKSTK